MHRYMNMGVRVYVCASVFVCVRVWARVFVFVCTHTHTHTYTNRLYHIRFGILCPVISPTVFVGHLNKTS